MTGVLKGALIERYSMDEKKIVIDGQAYTVLRLKQDFGRYYKKGEVCAYVSTNLSGNTQVKNSIFLPDKNDKTKFPIIKSGKGGRFIATDCSFVGNVTCLIGSNSGIKFNHASVSGNNVKFETTMAGLATVSFSSIDGQNIWVRDSAITNYEVQGANITMFQQSLLGSKDGNLVIGDGITLTAFNDALNYIEETNIEGDNVAIKNASTVKNTLIGDGTLVDNSEIVCEKGFLELKDATIVEEAKIHNFGDKTKIVDSTIEKSDITIGKNQDLAKLKDEDRVFEVSKSVVSSCSGDMPKTVQNSLLQNCSNICQYKKIETSHVVNEEYEQPLFNGLLKRFGFDKAFYADDLAHVYVSTNIYEDLNSHLRTVKQENAKKLEEEKTDKKDLDLVLF